MPKLFTFKLNTSAIPNFDKMSEEEQAQAIPQLILSLIYINSKREPQKQVTLYFFRMQNCYFPYALILLNVVSGGGIYDNIVGIIAGNIYFVLKDVLPMSKNLNILKTPKFLVDSLEKYYYSRLPRDEPNNNNDNNGGTGFGNSGVMNRGRAGDVIRVDGPSSTTDTFTF